MTEIELPKYRPNWHIWAAKISEIIPEIKGGAVIRSLDSDHDFFVDKSYVDSFDPQIGGYYVLMMQGYESYQSPEEMKNYLLIEGGKS
jgi:hypothetical protein